MGQAHGIPPTAYCLLPTAYCLLPTAYCLLPTAYCLLPTAYCLLPTLFRGRSVAAALHAADFGDAFDGLTAGLEDVAND